jgi:hypothetical protein
MTTIRQDVADTANTEFVDGVDAEDAFTALWGLKKDAETPSDEDTKEEDEKPVKPAKDDNADEDDDAADGDEGSEETPETDDDEDGDEEGDDENAQTVEVKDEHKFKVTVDGEEREFSLGQLKRLAGQEAALTRKSQEVAKTRTTLDEQSAAYLARQTKLLERARSRYEPLSKIDLLAASKDPNVTQEELIAARNTIQAAYEEVQFLEQDLGAFTADIQKAQAEELRAQAQEAIKVLSDPEKGIEGFNQPLYQEICSFAVEAGLPAEMVNNLVNPAAIKLLNMARMFAKGKTQVQSAKPDKKKAPKRIVKGTASAEGTKTVKKSAKAAEPMKRLQKSGSTDDAADAFMARWNGPAED